MGVHDDSMTFHCVRWVEIGDARLPQLRGYDAAGSGRRRARQHPLPLVASRLMVSRAIRAGVLGRDAGAGRRDLPARIALALQRLRGSDSWCPLVELIWYGF
jgi:hypothetical protein